MRMRRRDRSFHVDEAEIRAVKHIAYVAEQRAPTRGVGRVCSGSSSSGGAHRLVRDHIPGHGKADLSEFVRIGDDDGCGPAGVRGGQQACAECDCREEQSAARQTPMFAENENQARGQFRASPRCFDRAVHRLRQNGSPVSLGASRIQCLLFVLQPFCAAHPHVKEDQREGGPIMAGSRATARGMKDQRGFQSVNRMPAYADQACCPTPWAAA